MPIANEIRASRSPSRCQAERSHAPRRTDAQEGNDLIGAILVSIANRSVHFAEKQIRTSGRTSQHRR